MIQEIYIIEDVVKTSTRLRKIFKDRTDYRLKSVKSDRVEVALRNIPSLIIIDEDRVDITANEICIKIRSNEDNLITPIIVLSSNPDHGHRLDILKLNVIQYIKNPIEEELLFYTVKNILDLLYINRRISPLTGLPR